MPRLLAAFLVLLALAGCTRLKPLAPIAPQKSDEASPPLKIEVYCPKTAADLAPVIGLYGNSAVLDRLYVIARITNISSGIVVLPGFCRGSAGFEFTCASSNARHPPFFRILDGQLEWIFLKPGESTYAIDTLTDYITFLKPGHYAVEYQLSVGYACATGPSLDLNEAAKIYRREHKGVKLLTFGDGKVDKDAVLQAGKTQVKRLEAASQEIVLEVLDIGGGLVEGGIEPPGLGLVQKIVDQVNELAGGVGNFGDHVFLYIYGVLYGIGSRETWAAARGAWGRFRGGEAS